MEVPAELAEVSMWGVSSLYLYGKLVDENGPFVDDLYWFIYYSWCLSVAMFNLPQIRLHMIVPQKWVSEGNWVKVGERIIRFTINQWRLYATQTETAGLVMVDGQIL